MAGVPKTCKKKSRQYHTTIYTVSQRRSLPPKDMICAVVRRRRGGAARSVSRALRPQRLSLVDNKPCSACRASDLTVSCWRCASCGGGATRAHSRHPAASPTATSLMPMSQCRCEGRRREAEEWRVSHERSAGTAHRLGGLACRDALRRGVGLEGSHRLTRGGGCGSRSEISPGHRPSAKRML